MNDAELAAAVREGGQQAFAAIYDRYADRMHDFCTSLLRERHEAADAMQDDDNHDHRSGAHDVKRRSSWG